MSKGIYILLTLLLTAVSFNDNAIFMRATAQEEAVEINVLADQIRSQGFACSSPLSAERIAAETAPDEPVYLLKCESGTYQVRLIPDQAAVVTRIE